MSSAEPEPTAPHPAPRARPVPAHRPSAHEGAPASRAPSRLGATSPKPSRSGGTGTGRPRAGTESSAVPVARTPAAPVARTTVAPRLRRPVRANGSTRVRRPAGAPKRQLPRLSKARLAVLAAGLLMLLGVAAYALYFSSWLVLDTIEVEGNTTVSTAEVLSTAALELGEPLARVDTDAAAERVAAQLLPIGSVRLQRDWPDAVVISVVERQPALAIADVDGYSVLDPSGFAFLHEDAPPAGVPLLSATGTTPVGPAAQEAVLKIVPQLPDAVRARVVDITAATLDSITLNLTDGVTVVWGSAEDSGRKGLVLTELMQVPATLYNVSAPDVPAIRPLPTDG